jgi:predicted NUDIX family phosphoesterase
MHEHLLTNYMQKAETDIQNAVLMGLIQDMSNETANVIVLLTDGQSSVNQNAVKSSEQ